MSALEEKLAAASLDDTVGGDDFVVDPSLKKKKKKKAIPADFDAEPAAAASPEVAGESDEPDFSELKKKKKKKAKEVTFDEDATEDGAAAAAAAGEGSPEVAPAASAEGDDDFDLGELKKKKKKSKKAKDLSAFEAELGGDDIIADDSTLAESAPASVGDAGEPWVGSSRDYTYEELLGRFFKTLRENNPELAGEKKTFSVAPPIVTREGSKKTAFANITDICKRMNRAPEHLIQFLFAELGTSGSTDGTQRLIIRGVFQQKQIENVLRSYFREYVICKMCKSADTVLTKDNRLQFMRCSSCASERTVQTIKTGFHAQTTKRKTA
ncbi:hypothetical protein GQ42DRAFT_180983 [Ramicandelaber brevisporus]|nr:hypothetical protein GQ42DRAFT_180983 [Ramicandelaber brevisporus]